ncbi:3-keto-disaccharide hydrolase [Algoriphagus aquimarinus]|uniref:3-keto-alpha-glucoside-1,2-lyase/3-keto-2-hydroxy-glucal hydratase domain-containing protein n=1 Tax=Algoriphagus aquimarinus TaxID=237018 RepID=A0A1I0ZM86_9BACT|nr:DUF1080 domain-containing protein [Algoriphagus aquimarinus]SFB25630.1 protein of unknown function [Algoriphagus aquimarinus]|tara:strand:+ start:22869 stop:23672 length:804 start_codon:yes stop_codon:yes gene_type:complete
MFRKILVASILGTALISCSAEKKETQVAEQPKAEWIDMFNGENLEDWTAKIYHHESGDNYQNTFRVVDGTIEVNYDDYNEGFNDRYGHLFYKKPFSSFHMTWEYRFTEQWLEDAASYTYRNSGVMFHSQAPETILKEQDWPISVEWQMLAEEKEGVPRPTGNMCSPGTDVFFEGKKDPRHCINSTSPTFKWDEWVKADLIVYGDSLVVHLVNDVKVLEYTLPQIGGGVANGFDPKYKEDGKLLKEGYIGLQSEGQGVIFKNLKIKEL